MFDHRAKYNVLYKLINIILACLFCANTAALANPDTLAPAVGNPKVYQEMRSVMEERLAAHQDPIDEFIKQNSGKAKGLSAIPYLEEEFMQCINACGAKNMLTRLKATLTSAGGKMQVVFVKSEDKLPVFEGKKAWGHAGTYVTVFALEGEKSSEEGRRKIISRLFHEIRARSTRAKELFDEELKTKSPTSPEEISAFIRSMREKFEKDNIQLQHQMEQSGRIESQPFTREFANLTFAIHPDVMNRDYMMANRPGQSDGMMEEGITENKGVSYKELFQDQLSVEYGGKAAWDIILERLAAEIGFSIPGSTRFTIRDIWAEFIEANQTLVKEGNDYIERDLKAHGKVTDETIEKLTERSRRFIFPKELEFFIRAHTEGLKGWAIDRSSGRHEDSYLRNLAGIFISPKKKDERLVAQGVKEIFKHAVERIWITENRSESKTDGIPNSLTSKEGFGVLIQPFLQFEASGTAMTNFYGHTSIEAVFGDADMAVRGIHANVSQFLFKKSDPSQFEYNPSFLTTPHQVRLKGKVYCVTDDLAALKSLLEIYPRINDKVSPISDTQAKELYRVISALEDEIGVPLDVEWGFLDGKLYIIQIRPIIGDFKKPLVEMSPDLKSKKAIAQTPIALGHTTPAGFTGRMVVFSNSVSKEIIQQFEKEYGEEYIRVQSDVASGVLGTKTKAKALVDPEQGSRQAHNINLITDRIASGEFAYCNGPVLKMNFLRNLHFAQHPKYEGVWLSEEGVTYFCDGLRGNFYKSELGQLLIPVPITGQLAAQQELIFKLQDEIISLSAEGKGRLDILDALAKKLGLYPRARDFLNRFGYGGKSSADFSKLVEEIQEASNRAEPTLEQYITHFEALGAVLKFPVWPDNWELQWLGDLMTYKTYFSHAHHGWREFLRRKEENDRAERVLLEQTAAVSQAPSTARKPMTEKLQILFVHDDKNLSSTIKGRFKKSFGLTEKTPDCIDGEGYTIFFVSDTINAEWIIRENRIDYIITDWMLADETETAERLLSYAAAFGIKRADIFTAAIQYAWEAREKCRNLEIGEFPYLITQEDEQRQIARVKEAREEHLRKYNSLLTMPRPEPPAKLKVMFIDNDYNIYSNWIGLDGGELRRILGEKEYEFFFAGHYTRALAQMEYADMDLVIFDIELEEPHPATVQLYGDFFKKTAERSRPIILTYLSDDMAKKRLRTKFKEGFADRIPIISKPMKNEEKAALLRKYREEQLEDYKRLLAEWDVLHEAKKEETAEQAAQPQAPAPAPTKPEKLKVLLIEDDVSIIIVTESLFRDYFNEEEYELVSVQNVNEAEESLSREKFHLIAYDLMFPGFGRIKDMLATSGASLILQTAANPEQTRARLGNRVGFYLQKPYSIQKELFPMIKSARQQQLEDYEKALAAWQAAQSIKTPTAQEARPPKLSLLVLEDNDLLRDRMEGNFRDIFTTDEYDLFFVSSYAEGLEILQKHDIMAVLVDLNLTSGPRRDFCNKLKDIEHIMVISGFPVGPDQYTAEVRAKLGLTIADRAIIFDKAIGTDERLEITIKKFRENQMREWEATHAAKISTAQAPIKLEELNILFVSDEAGYRKDAPDYFKEISDAKVMVCSNASEAIAYTKDHRVDIVIADYNIPMANEKSEDTTYSDSNIQAVLTTAKKAGEADNRNVALVVFSAWFEKHQEAALKGISESIQLFRSTEPRLFQKFVGVVKEAYQGLVQDYDRALAQWQVAQSQIPAKKEPSAAKGQTIFVLANASAEAKALAKFIEQEKDEICTVIPMDSIWYLERELSKTRPDIVIADATIDNKPEAENIIRLVRAKNPEAKFIFTSEEAAIAKTGPRGDNILAVLEKPFHFRDCIDVMNGTYAEEITAAMERFKADKYFAGWPRKTPPAPKIREQRLLAILDSVDAGQEVSDEEAQFIKSCCEYYGYKYMDMLDRMKTKDIINTLLVLVGLNKEEGDTFACAGQFVSSASVLGDEAISHEYGHFYVLVDLMTIARTHFKGHPEVDLLFKRIAESRRGLSGAKTIMGTFNLNNQPKILSGVANLAVNSAEEAVVVAGDFIRFLERQDQDFKEDIQRIRAAIDSTQAFLKLLQNIRLSLLQPSISVEYGLNALLKEIAEPVLGPDVKKGYYSLEFDIDNELPTLQLYSDIWFVWTNLYTNARDAISEKDEQAGWMHKGFGIKVSSKYDKAHGMAVVTVTDNGIGISQDNIDKIWQRGFTTKKEGTGKGLAIVQDVIKHNGGTIDVQSEPGKGAAFTIRLPIAPSSGSRSSVTGVADTLKTLPQEWRGNDLKAADFLAEISRLLQIQTVLDQDKSTFIFSEKVTFDNGLGIFLPKLAKSGMKVAVITVNDRQRALIDDLNQGKPANERIIYADTIAEIRTKIHTARYYYFKVAGDPDTNLQGVTTFDITEIVKKIIDALGRISGITERERLELLREAARKFAEAA
ncbi:MAG: ATP-binding protein [Candidatus Omnitrophota bacterium]|nr:ATP-binding protein [Candidatus Omnitrophota bacterium]